MKNKLYNFYLANYKALHHSVSIIMMAFFMILVDSLIVDIPLFDRNFESLAFNLIMLYITYKVTVFTLDKSGLDEQVKKEIEEIKKKQTS